MKASVESQSQKLTAQQLKELKDMMRKKLEEAQKIVAEQEQVILDAREDRRRGPGDSEDCQDEQTVNEAQIIIRGQQKLILSIQDALHRMRAGTYGYCKQTGQPIPYERLRLVPHASLCLAAKKEQGFAA